MTLLLTREGGSVLKPLAYCVPPLPGKVTQPLYFSSITLSLYFCLALVHREPRFWQKHPQRRGRAGERRRNGSFTGKCPVLGLGLCLLFLQQCLDWEPANLYSLLLIFLLGQFVITFLFFPFLTIVKTGCLDCFSLRDQNLLSIVCILALYRTWWILNMN